MGPCTPSRTGMRRHAATGCSSSWYRSLVCTASTRPRQGESMRMRVHGWRD